MSDDRWTAGYNAARAFYRDTSALAITEAKHRLNAFTDQYGPVIPDTTPLGRLLHDLDTILNNTQEPRHEEDQ